MTEPALTHAQSALLRYLFARRIKQSCYCMPDRDHVCARCEDVKDMHAYFPATFVQACVDAAKGHYG
jgi:hypothetical protein